MAALEPYAWTRLKPWQWLTSHINHPGVLFVIVSSSVALMWHALFQSPLSAVTVVSVVVQIALLLCSYRFPIPALIACLAVSLFSDSTDPQYAAFGLYAIVTVLGLWAYQTNDVAAAGAVVFLSIYQLIWALGQSHTDAVSVLLFATIFMFVATLGAALRHFVTRLHQQQLDMQRMNEFVRVSAYDLHDAVSSALTEADLLLQECEQTMREGAAADRQALLAADRQIRARLDDASAGVARIVDLLIEQAGDKTDSAHSSEQSVQHDALRSWLAERDSSLATQHIRGNANLIAVPDVRPLASTASQRLFRYLEQLYRSIAASGMAQYELTVDITDAGVSVTCLLNGNADDAVIDDIRRYGQKLAGRAGRCEIEKDDSSYFIYWELRSSRV